MSLITSFQPPLVSGGQVKGTEVPNLRRSSACDCTWCIDLKSITVSWLFHACHVHSVLFLPMQSSLTSFWHSLTGLVQLILSFPTCSWFRPIWFYCSHTFHSFLLQITLCFLRGSFLFGSKDLITAFTCLLSYRYRSFTLRAYLCWRHTYSFAANQGSC